MRKKHINTTIDPELLLQIREEANRQMRPLNNMIEYMLRYYFASNDTEKETND